MSFIFISYSRQDQAYVKELTQALEEKNLPVWLDDRINSGEVWLRVLAQKIEESSAFLLVMSPRSHESDWVQDEILFARKLKKPIFPLLLECGQDNHWFSVARIQAVDVTGGTLPPAEFFQSIQKYLLKDISEVDKNQELSSNLEENIESATTKDGLCEVSISMERSWDLSPPLKVYCDGNVVATTICEGIKTFSISSGVHEISVSGYETFSRRGTLNTGAIITTFNINSRSNTFTCNLTPGSEIHLVCYCSSSLGSRMMNFVGFLVCSSHEFVYEIVER